MKLRHKLLIGLPVLAVVSAGGLLWGIQYTGQKALDDAMAGVVADGGPVDFLGFARPDLADADNAAVAWLRAVEPLETIDAAAPWVPEVSEVDASYGGGRRNIQSEVDAIEDPAAADLAVLSSAIATRQSVIDAMWAAADLEAVCWPWPYDDPGALVDDLTFYKKVRKGDRVLVADAWHAWQMGDAARADKSLAAVLAAAEDVMELPRVLGVMVAVSMDSMVMEAMAEMEIGGAVGFARTRAVLAERNYRRWLATAYLHEPVGVVELDYDSELWPDYLWETDSPVPSGLRGIVGWLWRKHDLAFHVETLCEMARLSTRPYPEAVAEIDALEARSIPVIFPISRLGLLMTDPDFVVARIDAQRALALWASEPDRDPPQDPLVGGVLRQWAADGGWVLWSSEAEDPDRGDYFLDRDAMVWRVGTRALPPELMPFADEINGVE